MLIAQKLRASPFNYRMQRPSNRRVGFFMIVAKNIEKTKGEP
jgi:hypothetical protein